ncbi:MAG: hypothetical protein IJW86_09635 [Clostridia bacterium]|nr:hypothetical protein [Clostridia bacterium]
MTDREELIELISKPMIVADSNDRKMIATAYAERILSDGWIRPPCKVGASIYEITRNFISEFRVRFIEIGTCSNLFLHTDLVSGIVYSGEVFPESEIGKTVFLTREEAEKTLVERQSASDG